MSNTFSENVYVQRIVERNLNEEKLKEALRFIGNSATRNRTYGFSVKIPRSKIVIQPIGDGRFRYSAVIVVFKEGFRNPGTVREYFNKVLENMKRAANRKHWEVVESAVNPEIPATIPAVPITPAPVKKIIGPTDIVIPPLSEDIYAKHFGRLYNREPQIRIIYDSASLAARTKFRERHHVLLRGPAATAKTETFGGFIDWWGEDKVWHVDATTLTKAGLERELISRSKEGKLAPFVLIEEIEKVTSPDNINCLLQVMDTRGRIQRTNAREGDTYADCNIVIWATCNDSNHLRSFADGAIWSRFSLRPICKRPDKDLMQRILTRTVHETNGRIEWVPIVIDFMWDKLKGLHDFKDDYNDPRLGRALLSGGDRLFDSNGSLKDFLDCCEGSESGED